MPDTDYDERARGAVEKAKNVAIDTAGHRSPRDKRDSVENADKIDGGSQKNTEHDGKVAAAFAQAKKKA